MNIDHSIIIFINKHIAAPWVLNFFNFISFLGNYGAIWIVILLLLTIRLKSKRFFFTWSSAFILLGILNEYVLKHFFARLRPFEVIPDLNLIIRPDNFSFPSGHSAFAAAGLYFLAKYSHSKKVFYFVLILSILMAFSRIVLKVHYFSDVVVGYVWGFCLAALVDYIFSKFKK